MAESDVETVLERAVAQGRPVDAVREGRALAGIRARMFGEQGTRPTLDRYILGERIGSGASAFVYRAFDPELDREVAIKLLQPRNDFDETDHAAQVRLLREAKAIAALSHPNVVAVHDVGTYSPGDLSAGEPGLPEELVGFTGDGCVYMVMELVDGATLDDWLTSEERSWRPVYDVFLGAGEGLAAAHAEGLVHRDFKPANVLVGVDGRPRVLDFGLVRTTGAGLGGELRRPSDSDTTRSSGPDLTQEGSVMGTPAYMAPEQHRGEIADERADVFAFCASLYYGLFGVRPFRGRSLGELEEAKLDGRMRKPLPGRHAPGWLVRIVMAGLEPDPERRTPTMRLVLHGMKRAPRVRRRWIAAGTLGVVVLGSVAASLTMATNARTDAACGDQAQELVGIWDGERARATHDGFLASEVNYAASTWTRVEPALDDYAQRWIQARTHACERTVARGEQSVSALQAQMQCLDIQRERLRELVDVLAAADAGVVQRAARAVSSLPDPETCLDAQIRVAQDVDEGTRERLVAVERELAGAQALRAVGRLDGARTRAERALALAGEDGVAPAQCRAHLELGLIDSHRTAFDDAEARLVQALEVADAAGEAEVAARAQIALVGVVGHHLRRFPEAEDRVHDATRRLAELDPGSDARTDPRTGMRAELAHNTGMLRVSQGRFEEARDAFAQEVELRRTDADGNPSALARALAAMGTVSNTLGELDTSEGFLRESLQELDRATGGTHPDAALARINLGTNLFNQGRYADAAEELDRANQMVRDTQGDDHLWLAHTAQIMGAVNLRRGQLDAAQTWFSDAATRYRATGAHPEMVGAALKGFAEVAEARDQPERAVEEFRKAVVVYEAAGGTKHPALVPALAGLLRNQVECGELEDAGATRTRLDRLVQAVEVAPEDRDDATIAKASMAWLKDPRGAWSTVREVLDRALASGNRETAHRARSWMGDREAPEGIDGQ